LSVVVPVRNEERFIGPLLEEILTQRYDPAQFEVLVADGRSTDATRAIVHQVMKRHPNLVLLDNPHYRASAGRNAGIRVARGDLIVIIDGHCRLRNPEYLASVVRVFRSTNADCLGRPQPLACGDGTPLHCAIGRARASWLGHHPRSYIYASGEGFVPPHSVAVVYQRRWFEQVGLFDESFDACEDVEFNHRLHAAGATCYFSQALSVTYQPRESLLALFQQMTRYGRGRMRLARKHPRTLSLGSALPALALVGAALLLLGSLWLPFLFAVLIAATAIYALLVLATSLVLAWRHGSAAMGIWLPFVFLTIHAGAGVGVLIELAAVLGPWREPVCPPPRLEPRDLPQPSACQAA
jgi:succinoglycan biosynthesis protein ExoA